VEIAILIVLALAALVVMVLVLRIVITAYKQSRRGEIPTPEQRNQIMILGGIGLGLALLALFVPNLF
jgi:multisubunit Na+/H+ antiporter MnhB subunit